VEKPVVSVLALHVLPGSEPAVADAYDELGGFERARESGGFRFGRLLAPVEGGGPMLVIAEWDDAASYDRWLSNPVRKELGVIVKPLLAGDPSPVGVFYATATGPADRGSPG
jgi:heme-degrading monooxygenase HmoA